MSANLGSDATGVADDDLNVNKGQQQQHHTDRQPEALTGLAALRQSVQAPIGRSTAGEAINRFKSAIEKVLEKEGDGAKNLIVLVLDGKIRGSALSSILLVRHADGKAAVANLIVAASEPNLRPTEIKTSAGGTVELPTVPGAVNNRAYWDKIRAVVRERLGEVTPVFAGANVIPLELDPDDEERVRKLVYYTDCGIYNTLLNATGRSVKPFSASLLQVEGVKITARRNFSPEPVETATGLPVRADLIVSTVATENSKSPLDASAVPLAQVCAMVDLLYAPPEPAGVGQVQATQHYMAHIIATKLEPVTDRIGLEGQLFALLQLPLLAKHYSWANVYRNREAVQGVDTRDIGAIGFDVPAYAGRTDGVPTRIETKSPSFDTGMFLNLVQAAIRPNPIISIDVEDTGEMTWLNALFVAAANGNEEANQLIVQAFDNLTNGNFTKIFKGGPIFVDSGNPIHLGYYIDHRDGQRHDIREIDYLAYLNAAGQTEPKAVRDFEDTFDSTAKDPLLRLEKRLTLIQHLTGTSVRVTGTGRRITVNPVALEAGVNALVSTGLVITPDTVYADLTGNGRRGNEVLSRLAFQGQGFNQLFAHSQPNFLGGNGAGAGTMFGGYR